MFRVSFLDWTQAAAACGWHAVAGDMHHDVITRTPCDMADTHRCRQHGQTARLMGMQALQQVHVTVAYVH